MKLKRCLALTRAGVIENLQFRLSMLVMVIGNILYLIVIYYLWKAIYASAGTDVVNGMTFTDTMIYLVLATSLFGMMDLYTVWMMGRDIQSGKIVLDLLKPMGYRSWMFWSFSGNLVTNSIFTFLPTFIVVAVVANGAIPLGLNLLWFAISVIMSISISYSIDFFVGTICLYTESIWGINIMKDVTVLLLSGATIPIAFFPEPLQTIAYYLPFQSIYNTPLTLLLNKDPMWQDIVIPLGTQLIWVIAMFVITRVFWKISLKQITVNGG